MYRQRNHHPNKIQVRFPISPNSSTCSQKHYGHSHNAKMQNSTMQNFRVSEPLNMVQNPNINYTIDNWNNRTNSSLLNLKITCKCPKNGIWFCRQQKSTQLIDITRPNDFIAMECTNDFCKFNSKHKNYLLDPILIHRLCQAQLESELILFLKNSTSTVGYSDKDRKARLWENFHSWIGIEGFGNLVACFECRRNRKIGYVKLNVHNFHYNKFISIFEQRVMMSQKHDQTIHSNYSYNQNKNDKRESFNSTNSYVHSAQNSYQPIEYDSGVGSGGYYSPNARTSQLLANPVNGMHYLNNNYHYKNNSAPQRYNNSNKNHHYQQQNHKFRSTQPTFPKENRIRKISHSIIKEPQAHNQTKQQRLPKIWSIEAIPGPANTGCLSDIKVDEIWLKSEFNQTFLNSLKIGDLPTISEIEWLQEKQKQVRDVQDQDQITISSPIPSKKAQNDNKEHHPLTEYEPIVSITFPPRADFSDFTNIVSLTFLNPYHIMMEAADGGQANSFGVDHLRSHILSNLSQCNCRKLPCILCTEEMVVFQQFPLVAGLMYLTADNHGDTQKAKISNTIKKVQLENDNQHFNLHAVCVKCCQGYKRKILCNFCNQPWSGIPFQLGTLYMHDVFACFPCCSKRRKCQECDNEILKEQDIEDMNFSSFSNEITCLACGLKRRPFIHSISTYRVVYYEGQEKDKG